MSRTDFVLNGIKSRSYTSELNAAFDVKARKEGYYLYSTDSKGRKYVSDVDKQLSRVIKDKADSYYKDKLAKRNGWETK